MTTGLLIVLLSLSAIVLAGAILIGVRHFWKLEEELNEGIRRLLAEPESEPRGERPSPEPTAPETASAEPEPAPRENESTEGSD
jgi:hypothetical protein